MREAQSTERELRKSGGKNESPYPKTLELVSTATLECVFKGRSLCEHQGSMSPEFWATATQNYGGRAPHLVYCMQYIFDANTPKLRSEFSITSEAFPGTRYPDSFWCIFHSILCFMYLVQVHPASH